MWPVLEHMADAEMRISKLPLTHSVAGGLQAVLVGDPQQLPATVLSSKAQRHHLAQSLFERLQRVRSHSCNALLPSNSTSPTTCMRRLQSQVVLVAQAQYPVALLNEQYRMHPAISTWCMHSVAEACMAPACFLMLMHCKYMACLPVAAFTALGLMQAVKVLLQQQHPGYQGDPGPAVRMPVLLLVSPLASCQCTSDPAHEGHRMRRSP